MASVLIVDDSTDSRLIARVLLESEGYEIREAPDGELAIELLESGLRPDLVVLDLRMPRMDGFEVLDRLARSPDLADLPVVVVSAHADLVESERFVRGPSRRPVMLKPFHPDDFMDLIRSMAPGSPTSS